MAKRRVVITGAGVVSPLGNATNEFFANLIAGRSGIRLHPERSLPYEVGFSAFRSDEHFSRMQLLGLDRVSQFALVAAAQAVAEAGLDHRLPLGDEVGVLFGTGGGGVESMEDAYAAFFDAGGKNKKLLTVPAAMVHAPASQIALRFGARGECQTYSTACSSSTVAIGEAFRRVRDGYWNCAIAGGADATLTPGVLDNWAAMRVLCESIPGAIGTACRPFSADRTGFLIGEGAGVFVLELAESAAERGAPPLAEIVGYGVSNDAKHITRPDAAGQALAMRRALNDAHLEPNEVGYINAHGTATVAGDRIETESIKAVFGEHARALSISSTKSAHGHLMGASGAVEFLATAMALREQVIPPTTHWSRADPECDLDYVPGVGRKAMNLNVAMCNSFAFGGNNAVLVVKRCS